MERRSTKHGPQRDDQLKHELQSMERGAPQRPHIEEWREVEPAGDVPVAGRQPPGHHQAAEDIALRSELARVLSRSDFPADRDTLLGRLSDADAPAGLVARLARVTADRPFTSAHEVMVALGINEPERRPR
jgi:uncharacterized protein DUF2795